MKKSKVESQEILKDLDDILNIFKKVEESNIEELNMEELEKTSNTLLKKLIKKYPENLDTKE